MQRTSWLVLAAALFSTVETAQADWVHDAFHSIKRDFHRNNAWPEPFNGPERGSVEAPFAVMIHNGWRMQNTLSQHHFRAGTNELTEAGQLKVMWILTEAPMQHRTIYVERGANVNATAKRIHTVHLVAGGITPEGAVVMEAPVPARGAPADQIDATTRQWLNSVPAPRLPASGGGGASSGGE